METSWPPYLIAVIVAVVSFIVHRRKNYWKRRGVPTTGSIFTGCFTDTFKGKENLSLGLQRVYTENKDKKFVGTFLLGQPLLILNDPEIIKQVFLTEYPNFASHGIFYDTKSEGLSPHLFSLAGEEWKAVRSKMSVLFSSGKIKSTFPVVLKKVQHLEKKIGGENSIVVPYNIYMRKLSIDVICASFFNIEANCLDDNESQFTQLSYMLNLPIFGQLCNFLLFTHYHKLSSFLINTGLTRFFPKSSDDFMIGFTKDLMELRSKSGESRSDIIDVLLKLRNSINDGKIDRDRDFILATAPAQLFVLFAAGFETTSQANTLAMYEMAKQPEIQRKVQEECDRVLKESGGEITYDAISKMEYTDKVIKETLRLYPALQFLIRSAVKPVKLPTTDVQLEKDTNIWIPLLGLHKDPQYFPDPLKFDPERFSPENAASIPSQVYMPFGDGPRTCIGMRYGVNTMRTTILKMLSKYDVTLTEETPKTIEYEPYVYFPLLRADIPLRLTPRANK